MVQILEISNQKDLLKALRQVKVDPYGIKIMAPKARHYLIKLNAVSNIAANILKQEMLSLGGDVAVARGALTGKVNSTDCLVMASYAQLNRLKEKLAKQPFGLSTLACELRSTLNNYERNDFKLDLGARRFNLQKHSVIMGIMNLTPDSFSGDGLYQSSESAIIEFAQKLVRDGADILDIGAESSRPGAKSISLKEELARLIPVVKLLRKKVKVPLSIDTYKPQVARPALDNGADMINDISGLRDPKMAKLVSSYKAAVVIMHMQGNPRSMQKNPRYTDVMGDIAAYLGQAVKAALDRGVAKDKIIIDPGIGFGKTPEHNFQILKRLKELKALGMPLLVGPSRKSFIGKILNTEAQERVPGTISACLLAVQNGANLLRVHDVSQVKQAVKVWETLTKYDVN